MFRLLINPKSLISHKRLISETTVSEMLAYYMVDYRAQVKAIISYINFPEKYISSFDWLSQGISTFLSTSMAFTLLLKILVDVIGVCLMAEIVAIYVVGVQIPTNEILNSKIGKIAPFDKLAQCSVFTFLSGFCARGPAKHRSRFHGYRKLLWLLGELVLCCNSFYSSAGFTTFFKSEDLGSLCLSKTNKQAFYTNSCGLLNLLQCHHLRSDAGILSTNRRSRCRSFIGHDIHRELRFPSTRNNLLIDVNRILNTKTTANKSMSTGKNKR